MEPEGTPVSQPALPARLMRRARLSLEVAMAFFVFAMMVLTFADVVGRYIFSAPIPGAFEIIEFIMALVIFCGLPLVTILGGHITVSLLDGFIPKGLVWYQRLFIYLFSIGVAVFLTAALWNQARVLGESGMATVFLDLPIAPLVTVITVLSAVALAILCGQAIRHALSDRSGGRDREAGPPPDAD